MLRPFPPRCSAMVAIGGSTGAAETLLALANAAASNSSLTGQTTRREPHTLWLQNLAIAIEVLAVVLSIVSCSLRAYIRTKTKNLGWGMLSLITNSPSCTSQ